MKKIEISELLKRISICLLCVATIVSIAFLFAYMHTMLLSKGYELAAHYVSEAMPSVLLVVVLFIVWFVYDQVFSKLKEVELPISIELANSDDKRITFADAIIDDPLKQRLQMICCGKMTEETHKLLGNKSINSLRGYILYGPPGNDKTLIARAIAGGSNMNFISISGPELIGVYIGHGAHAVRELFKIAKKYSPCIVFIDEIDAVAQKRSTANDSAYHCRESLTQLLTEIDGFKSRKDIIVIGATNLIGGIDPALIRPGRLGQKVYIPNPSIRTREKILALYMRGIKTDEKLSLQGIAGKTEGYSGAELEQLVNEAKMRAGEQRRLIVSEQDFSDALHGLSPEQERDRTK
ncbi:AAA family ATPase [Wolbachia endosymbiont of Drosophila bocqueti]|uniref:ATP-binding protein n=1 Tax=Wolbachia endosymbiont of Drosophila bocqueti TaxID=3079769 RepID=UPI0023AC52DC|nr:AAA family ATPase [Wolbachia endosymbiont of Drosophila bocqueti]MDE5062784.1 AAA family ATPase [Wolbachia endosymbiont of Drosophila chauvacae]MDU8909550.1 AAA family ATPase [Wolbachia endosymbiont of Drosophila bocqueti]